MENIMIITGRFELILPPTAEWIDIEVGERRHSFALPPEGARDLFHGIEK